MAFGTIGKAIKAVVKKRPKTGRKTGSLEMDSPLGITDTPAARRAKKGFRVKRGGSRDPSEEAASKAQQAERGVQPDKVKAARARVSPARKTAIDKMDAGEIAQKYTGAQIAAMQRKFKDPKVLKKLKKAREYRTDLVDTLEDTANLRGTIPPRKEERQYRKRGGKVGSAKRKSKSRPKGVGAAQRGWGATGKS
jgi:hypothetical protein